MYHGLWQDHGRGDGSDGKADNRLYRANPTSPNYKGANVCQDDRCVSVRGQAFIDWNAQIGATSATSYTLTTPTPDSGQINVASGNFTVTPNRTYNSTITITPSGGGLSTPIVLSWSDSARGSDFHHHTNGFGNGDPDAQQCGQPGRPQPCNLWYYLSNRVHLCRTKPKQRTGGYCQRPVQLAAQWAVHRDHYCHPFWWRISSTNCADLGQQFNDSDVLDRAHAGGHGVADANQQRQPDWPRHPDIHSHRAAARHGPHVMVGLLVRILVRRRFLGQLGHEHFNVSSRRSDSGRHLGRIIPRRTCAAVAA